MSKLVVITIDGLATELLGCYGSNTAVTPAIDRLAASGWVFDNVYLDSLDLPEQMTSLWTASHLLQRSAQGGRSADVQTEIPWKNVTRGVLVTDDCQVAELAERNGFGEVSLISTGGVEEQTASEVDLTGERNISRVTELFLASAEELTGTPSELIWIHSKGLMNPWDAPQDLRCKFKDTEDPDPPSESLVPSFEVDSSTDPDFVLGWIQVAAAQAALIDDSIAMLMEVISSRPDSADWNILLLTVGGIPLGARGHLGSGRKQLTSTELQCGCIINCGDQVREFGRVGDTMQIHHVGALIDELIQSSNSIWDLIQSLNGPQPVVAETKEQSWIRVPAWSANISSELDEEPSLYAQPDDRWELSNVAKLIPHVVNDLEGLVKSCAESYQCNLPLPTMTDEMKNIVR